MYKRQFHVIVLWLAGKEGSTAKLPFILSIALHRALCRNFTQHRLMEGLELSGESFHRRLKNSILRRLSASHIGKIASWHARVRGGTRQYLGYALSFHPSPSQKPRTRKNGTRRYASRRLHDFADASASDDPSLDREFSVCFGEAYQCRSRA